MRTASWTLLCLWTIVSCSPLNDSPSIYAGALDPIDRFHQKKPEKSPVEIRQPPDAFLPADVFTHPNADDDVDYHLQYMNCNEAYYGHPRPRDCQTAVARLPFHFSQNAVLREFYNRGGPYPLPAPGLNDGPISVPMIQRYGKQIFRRYRAVI